MQYICSIVSKRIIDVPEYVFLTKSYENVIQDKPILIIGTEKVKEIFPELKLKYIDRVINQEKNIFWTVSPFEKRTLMEDDLNNFYDFSIKSFIQGIKYDYINIIKIDKSKLKKIISFFNNEKKLIYLENNNSFLYAYFGNNIIGINLEQLVLLNIKKEKVIKKLSSNENNIFCENIIINENSRELLKRLNYDKKYLPLFNCNF